MFSLLSAVKRKTHVLIQSTIFHLYKSWIRKFALSFAAKWNEVQQSFRNESTVSKTKAYKWYKCFQDGCEDTENDDCTGHPSTSTTNENVKKVEEMITKDHRSTIREVADDVGTSIGSCYEIFSSV